MGGKTSRYGSGVYRRGNVYWLKVRTPAAMANLLPKPFWRSSLRTNLQREAHCAARSVRAALDAGFVVVEARMRLGVLSETQAEAVITALARRALSEHEALRANAGPRSEAAIQAARRDHEAEADAWRDVLRRNDLGVVAPLVAAATAEAGLTEPNWALIPDLLREAARTLAAVAEENVAREDGIYAGDHARLRARLAAAETGPARALDGSSGFARGQAPAWPDHRAERTRAAADRPADLIPPRQGPAPSPSSRPSLVWDAAQPGPAVKLQDPAAGASSPGAVLARAVGSTAVAPVGAMRAVELVAPEGICRRSVASPAKRPARNVVSLAETSSRKRETARGHLDVPSSPAPDAPAGTAKASAVVQPPKIPGVTPVEASPLDQKPDKTRRGAYRAQRRGAPDPVVAELRTRSPEELWNMTLEEAFAFTKAKFSSSGTNAKWMKGSARGFDASGRLAMAYFGSETRLRDITSGDGHNFVDRLALIPDNWNKGAKCSLIESSVAHVSMQALIDAANDLEDARLSEVERRKPRAGRRSAFLPLSLKLRSTGSRREPSTSTRATFPASSRPSSRPPGKAQTQ